MVIDIVLHYVTGHGGVEQVVTTVTQNLTKRGHHVRVFFAYFPEHIEWLGSLPEKHFFGLKLLRKKDKVGLGDFVKGYADKLREIGLPDICIGTGQPYTCEICYQTLYKEIGIQIPIISWLQEPTCTYDALGALMYATGHLAISKFMEKDISNYTVHMPIYYVGTPVQIKEVKCIPRPQEGLSLVYIGRLINTPKRIDILLNALARVEGKWQLTVIGDGVDRALLEELGHKLSIHHKIIWKDWQDEPWEQVETASLLLSASKHAGFSLSIAEGLARGVPVLATHCEGSDELIMQGENGWLVEQQDEEGLAGYIKEILEGKLKLPEGQVCRNSIEAFEENKVCEQIESVLYEARARLTWVKLYEHMGHLWGKV